MRPNASGSSSWAAASATDVPNGGASGSWAAASTITDSSHCYPALHNGSWGAPFAVDAAVANGTRTWDLYPEAACFQGAHLAYALIAVPTLLLFMPVALRLGAVDGDPARLQELRAGARGHYGPRALLRGGWWAEGEGDFAGPLSEATTGKKFGLVATLSRLVMSLADVMLTTHHQYLSFVFFAATTAECAACFAVPLFSHPAAQRAHQVRLCAPRIAQPSLAHACYYCWELCPFYF